MKGKGWKAHRVAGIIMVQAAILLQLAGCGKQRDDSVYRPQEEETVLSYNQDALPNLSLQEGYEIAGFGEAAGEDYTYDVYWLRQVDGDINDTKMYWEIAVMQEGEVLDRLRIEDGEHGAAFPVPADIVVEYDVNFDGKNDILLNLGHFGAQGAVSYKCYLAAEGGFEHCSSFTDIANPCIDAKGRVVRSSWRNSADSHGYGIYAFRDGEFVMTDRLTQGIERKEGDEGEATEIWNWTEERLIDGGWQVTEYFTEEDYDSETIHDKLDGADSFWRVSYDCLEEPVWPF